MIRLDVAQGSPEWYDARLGLPTASAYDRILTPKKLQVSASATAYRNQLLVEYLFGIPVVDADATGFMRRGAEMESEAVAWYEMHRDVDVDRVGFCLHDDRRTGCSPDGLVGDEGGLEMKCPSAHVHVGYLLDGLTDEYRLQVQGGLWVTGRQWWDFLSYHPTLPAVLVRMHRDDECIAALNAAIPAFCDQLDAAKEILASRGVVPRTVAA